MNLFQRLIFFFMIVVLIPLFVTSGIIYYQSSVSIEKQVEEYLDHIISNINLQMDQTLKEYELITLPLLTDESIDRFLELGPNEEAERYDIYSQILYKMSNITTQNPNIDLLYIIGDNGRTILSEERYYSPNHPFPEKEIHRKLSKITPDSGAIIIDSRENYDGEIIITLARKIKGKDLKTKGIIAVDIQFSNIVDISTLDKWKKGRFLMVVDEKDEIVFHSDSKFFGITISQNIQRSLNRQDSGGFYSSWNDEQMYYYYHHSEFTNWKTIVAIPKSELLKPISGIRTTTLLTVFLSVIVASTLAFSFTRGIVKPIRILQNRLKKMEKGIWEKVPSIEGTDEISSLVTSFNRMVDELKKLVDKVYKEKLNTQKVQLELQNRELEWKTSELQALQSQINPHFLYNTLETMNAYAFIKGADEITEMTDALAYMFRYSVRRVETVKLVDELEHIRNYMIIQEHRLQRSIHLAVEVDSNWLLEDTVKLSLQPLVENAIEHGSLKNKPDGKIIIDAFKENDLFYITVKDDGRGMSAERLQKINKNLSMQYSSSKLDGKTGIGVNNVHRRIQLIFGEKYGLQVESELGKGTRITIKLPAGKN